MRNILYFAALFLFSCGQQSSKEKRSTADTTGKKTDTVTKQPASPAPDLVNKDEEAINVALQTIPGNKLHVLNDKTARWMKDAFDYFILPKRKADANYPYIARGDFNADGKADTAALVRDSTTNKYRLLILLAGRPMTFWDQDIFDDAAINTLSKPGEIQGMNEDIDRVKIVKTSGDVIEVYYFEQSSFAIYWDKRTFKQVWTSD